MEFSRTPLAIVGSTASGKSALALKLSELLGDCELVSVDSMQVYRGMDIGTAKPTLAEQQLVPHHCIDLLDPSATCSVGWFQNEALAAVRDISSRGKRVIFVGGTGLYHRAVVDGLQIPSQYPLVSAQLEQEPRTEVLYQRLVELDPLAAARTEPNNRRRIIRALEVCIGSGKQFSSFGPGLTEYPHSPVRFIGLEVQRDLIGDRLANRTQAMLDAGWCEEAASLRTRIPPLGPTASKALGYSELFEYLDGRCSLEDANGRITQKTRNFAVRQHRWFRRDPRIEWFDCETRRLGELIADTLE